MKKYAATSTFLALIFCLSCDSNNPSGPASIINPPGPNPAPPCEGVILALENAGARFQLAAISGDTLNVRTDKSTEIYREGEDPLLSPADLAEGQKVSVEGVYQGSPKEKTIRAGYIFIYAAP